MLQICGWRLVPVRLDRLVHSTATFTHTSVRELLLMDVQKLGVLDIYGVSLQIVTSYERKLSIYPHTIFCTELLFTTAITRTINMLPFGTKRIICVTITIKRITTALLNVTASYYSIGRGFPFSSNWSTKTLINTIFVAEDTHK